MNLWEKHKPLLILAGPTAVGKTGTSIALAKALDGECISADSVQVYKGLDIGSGKVKEEEKEGIPHHLLDILNPSENYDASLFQWQGKELPSFTVEKNSPFWWGEPDSIFKPCSMI